MTGEHKTDPTYIVDIYKLLGLSPGSPAEEVNKSFEAKKEKYDPGFANELQELLEIQKAQDFFNSIVSNNTKYRYDQSLPIIDSPSTKDRNDEHIKKSQKLGKIYKAALITLAAASTLLPIFSRFIPHKNQESAAPPKIENTTTPPAKKAQVQDPATKWADTIAKQSGSFRNR